MAALTADLSLRIVQPEYTHKFTMDSTAARTWYKGEPMVIDQDVDTTHVVPGQDTTHPHMTATDVFVGVAAEGGAHLISVPEDLAHGVVCYIEPSIVGFKSTVWTTNANIGATVYWESGALSLEGTDTVPLGKIMWVEDGYVYVKLSTAIAAAADS